MSEPEETSDERAKRLSRERSRRYYARRGHALKREQREQERISRPTAPRPTTPAIRDQRRQSGSADGRILGVVLNPFSADGSPAEYISFSPEFRGERSISEQEWLDLPRKKPHVNATLVIGSGRLGFDPLDSEDISRIIRRLDGEPEVEGVDENVLRKTLASIRPGGVFTLVSESM